MALVSKRKIKKKSDDAVDFITLYTHQRRLFGCTEL